MAQDFDDTYTRWFRCPKCWEETYIRLMPEWRQETPHDQNVVPPTCPNGCLGKMVPLRPPE